MNVTGLRTRVSIEVSALLRFWYLSESSLQLQPPVAIPVSNLHGRKTKILRRNKKAAALLPIKGRTCRRRGSLPLR